MPGIGPKTAGRLTYYLLHVPQYELDKFAEATKNLKLNTKECNVCHNISESDPCDICGDQSRDKSIVCVVEQPLDVLAFERSGRYKGVYHVLHGVIDPLHNIGPDEIKINELLKRDATEIILALNTNMEGEATCMYLKKQFQISKNVRTASKFQISRLAHGLPMGSDIEYADETTLNRALEGRREY